MIAMLLMLVGCLAAWAHVLRMLEGASERLGSALQGEIRQGGGWMPSAAVPVRRAAASRAFTRA